MKDPETIKQAAKMIRAGMRSVDIAKTLNVHESTVCLWRRQMGMPKARRDHLDAEILHDAQTMTSAQIAAKYGYSRANIYRVLNKHHAVAIDARKARAQAWQQLRA